MRPERKERTDLVRFCKSLQRLPFFTKGNMKPLEFCAEEWQDLTYGGEHHCGCYVKSRLWAGKVKQKDLLGSYWTDSGDRWWWLVSNSGEEFLAKVIKSGGDCIYLKSRNYRICWLMVDCHLSIWKRELKDVYKSFEPENQSERFTDIGKINGNKQVEGRWENQKLDLRQVYLQKSNRHIQMVT